VKTWNAPGTGAAKTEQLIEVMGQTGVITTEDVLNFTTV
jgi:hypothetical protein